MDATEIDLIRDMWGDEFTDAVLKKIAGTTINIPAPAKLTKQHLLLRLLGRDDALKLCKALSVGGLSFCGIIPLGNMSRQRQVVQEAEALLLSGCSTRDVAFRLGIHERTAWRARKRLKDGQRPEVMRMLSAGLHPLRIAERSLFSVNELERLKGQLAKQVASRKLAGQ